MKKIARPPKLFELFLQRIILPQDRESLPGDFEEMYHQLAEEKGEVSALFWYVFQVLKLIPSFISNTIIWSVIMFKNYLKITLRSIKRHKGFSFINISGLAIGMTCTIIILLWVQHELSFDRFHEKADQLYRAYYTNVAYKGHAIYLPGTLAAYLKDNYPEIINSTSYKPWQKKISVGEKSFLSTGSYVDPSFFEMFTFRFLKGDPKTAFHNPQSIVITEGLANKFFGSDDPIGKAITYYAFSEGVDLKVAGVIEDVPQNSHLQFDFLIPYEIGYSWMKTWENNAVHTYVMLYENSSLADINRKISGVLKIHRPESKDVLSLHPLKKIHLFAPGGGGQITYIYIFSAMALVILLIACINFMNLSTARSEKRFKEIGVKKVVGSTRLQLIKQFLSESVLLSFLALLLALLFTRMLLPSVNAILGTQLKLDFSGSIVLSLVAIAFLTGLLSGSYPAFHLSSFHPVAILKGQIVFTNLFRRKHGRKSVASSGGSFLRKILVVAQFSLSVFFIVCLMTISRQLDFIRNRDLGLDKEHIVVLQSMGELKQRCLAVKNELLRNPDIQSVSFSAYNPVEWESSMSTIAMNWTGKTTDRDFAVGENHVDYDYLKTFGVEMVQGRFFSEEYPTDASEGCVVNEAAVKEMELTDPIGTRITWRPGSQYENSRTIVGVIKDFHTQSLHREIKPFVLQPIEPILRYMANYMYIKIKSENIPQTLQLIEGSIKKFVPNDPFVYRFFDEAFDKLYQAEQLTGKLTRYITYLAVFISCLGLFGLASFSVERRTKEIGIRKVLGASVSKVFFLLTKDFTKWVILANLIAWPIAYIAMSSWLNNFAYRTSIGLWVFLLSGILALIVALITVSYQTVKAAIANPVDSLRYE